MRLTKTNATSLFVIIADGAAIVLAHMLAYVLRFEFIIQGKELINLVLGIIFLIPFKLFVFQLFGLYRVMWRYTGINDLQNLLRANAASSMIIFSSLLFFNRFEGLSRAVFLMDGIFCIMLTAGIRVIMRLYYSSEHKGAVKTIMKLIGLDHNLRIGKNTLLLGAGSAGEALIREILTNRNLKINPVGFLDDDPQKKGLAIHGIQVLGKIENIEEIALKQHIEQIFLTMPSASAQTIRNVVELCEKIGIPYKTLPGMGNLINGTVSIKDLRDVNYEDLLGRPPVELDDVSISDYLKNKIILVTGGGGSIGSELCRQILKYSPAILLILDNSEFNLFSIETELRDNRFGVDVVGLLGRVQDRIYLEHVLTQYRPEIVFHAAAYKHVPLVERFPWEGVINNVFGSKIIMESALKSNVKRFVLVSTDKAVRPTNVMGASKRVAEMLARSMNGGYTRFMAVRFGNVVGSSGSVVPFFRKQIQAGGPVTVTHPEATRYFMTTSEASKLILQAGAIGNGGEIFVLEMGTPVKILNMAEDLIRLSGKEPYKDINIVFTGLRDGEKIYEELLTNDEKIVSTVHKKIMVLGNTNNDLNHSEKELFRNKIDEKLIKLNDAANNLDVNKIKLVLKDLVPDYRPKY